MALPLWIGSVLVCFSLQPLTVKGQARREALQEHSWRLIRIGDSRVADSIVTTLQFGDTTYTLTGECNQAIGKYWTRGISRIGFTVPAGTWRACPGLNNDAKVANVLRRANRYRVHTSGNARSLSLRRGLRVLAVLEAK